MNKNAITSAIVLRLLLGWFMLFDGIGILMIPNWTAANFLLNAKTFPAFYAWFASPMNSWWVDPLNVWGIILIGVALLLGVGVRVASWAGALMMIVYYFPHYTFPVVTHGYIIEEHIIYAALFVFIALCTQAQGFGLANKLRKTFLGKIPVIKDII